MGGGLSRGELLSCSAVNILYSTITDEYQVYEYLARIYIPADRVSPIAMQRTMCQKALANP